MNGLREVESGEDIFSQTIEVSTYGAENDKSGISDSVGHSRQDKTTRVNSKTRIAILDLSDDIFLFLHLNYDWFWLNIK